MSTQLTLLTIGLILVVYMPGYFFKRFYFSGKFHKQFKLGEFAERFITTVFWGIIIQLITYQIANKAAHLEEKNFLGFVVSLYDKLSWTGKPSERPTDAVPPLPFTQCLYYLALGFFVSAAAGKLCHKIVRIFQLDVRSQVLRFSNDWHYILRGEEMSNIRDKEQSIVSTELDIFAENIYGGLSIYSGILKEYVVASNSEELELITLTGAKHIYVDGSADNIPISGDTFVIPYKHVKNINIRFNKKKRPKFRFNEKEYPMWLLRLLQSLYALVFFIVPFVIFDQKYHLGNLPECMLSVIAFANFWIYIGVCLYYTASRLNSSLTTIDKRGLNKKIIHSAVFIVACLAAAIYFYLRIK